MKLTKRYENVKKKCFFKRTTFKKEKNYNFDF